MKPSKQLLNYLNSEYNPEEFIFNTPPVDEICQNKQFTLFGEVLSDCFEQLNDMGNGKYSLSNYNKNFITGYTTCDLFKNGKKIGAVEYGRGDNGVYKMDVAIK